MPATKLKLETLKVEMVEDEILLVTLNRPADANALNTQMGRDLIKLFFQLEDDAGSARVVVMTGSGERFFCAGGDLKERNGMTNDAWLAQHRLFERAFWSVVECSLPVIGCRKTW